LGTITYMLPLPEDAYNIATVNIQKFWLDITIKSVFSVSTWILYVNY